MNDGEGRSCLEKDGRVGRVDTRLRHAGRRFFAVGGASRDDAGVVGAVEGVWPEGGGWEGWEREARGMMEIGMRWMGWDGMGWDEMGQDDDRPAQSFFLIPSQAGWDSTMTDAVGGGWWVGEKGGRDSREERRRGGV